VTAPPQWFIRMDAETTAMGNQGVFTTDKAPGNLRELALAAIEQTRFYPENGKTRLRDMIAGRPTGASAASAPSAAAVLHPHPPRASCTMAIMDQAADMHRTRRWRLEHVE
jgi:isoleucyl-tRNA synthetase